jgi:hypothetical protein
MVTMAHPKAAGVARTRHAGALGSVTGRAAKAMMTNNTDGCFDAIADA